MEGLASYLFAEKISSEEEEEEDDVASDDSDSTIGSMCFENGCHSDSSTDPNDSFSCYYTSNSDTSENDSSGDDSEERHNKRWVRHRYAYDSRKAEEREERRDVRHILCEERLEKRRQEQKERREKRAAKRRKIAGEKSNAQDNSSTDSTQQ